MENSETTSEAAAREAMEEANAEICNLTLYALFNLPHINQVYLIYRGQLNNGLASAGEESLEVKLFTENEIPWNELAFPVINETLKLYYKDRRNGHYNVHVGDIIRESDRTLTVNHY